MNQHSPASSIGSSAYTIVATHSDDEEKPLARSSSPFADSPLLPFRRREQRAKSSRKLQCSLLALAALLSVAGVTYAVKQEDALASLAKLVAAEAVAHDARGVPVVDFEGEHLEPEWACNPFKQAGRLNVNLVTPTETVWTPYDETCPPSQLMRHLMPKRASKKAKRSSHHQMAKKVKRSVTSDHTGLVARGLPEDEFDRSDETAAPASTAGAGADFLPWLVNATVLIQGDSIERLHITDFCEFIGGQLTNIDPHHPASPPTYHKPMPTTLDHNGYETAESRAAKKERAAMEKAWETDKQSSWPYTRPWVCDIAQYNATVVSVFAWGMEDYEDIYKGEDFFHGPSGWIDRFKHITLPLLDNLATHMGRPQIRHPNLVEVGSGFWDLRGMTETDFMEAGYSRPYPMDNDLPFGAIGEKREKLWAKHAKELLATVAAAFPGANGDVRSGPVISWRTMHQPKRNNYTPFTRVFALDQLARKTIHDLRVESLETHPNLLSTAKATIHNTTDKWLKKEADKGAEERVDYGFDERLRVNEIGKLLTGQDGHFKDFLHPNPVPGSFLWAEIMLYELKRAVAGAGRSAQ